MARVNEEGPLRGVSVLVTRAREDAEPLMSRLRTLGAAVLTLPTVEIVPPEDVGPMDEALRQLGSYHWITFSSRNAVRSTFRRLEGLGLPFPNRLRVAAIGPSTAVELESRRVRIDCQPDEASAQALAEALVRYGIRGKSILQPAGDLARPELHELLERAGACVDVVQAYRTVMPEGADTYLLDSVRRGRVDIIALASPSAARNLLSLLGVEDLRGVQLACIGPTTAQTVRGLGLAPAVVAASHTHEGLVAAIVELRTKGVG